MDDRARRGIGDGMDRDQSDLMDQNRMMRALGTRLGSALYLLLLTTNPYVHASVVTTILVCSVETSPDRCNVETAIDVTHGPTVANEIMCGKMGEAVLAGTALVPRPGIEYVKLTCVRQRGA